MLFWPHHTARGILSSRPGIAPAPLQRERRVLPTGPPGRSVRRSFTHSVAWAHPEATVTWASSHRSHARTARCRLTHLSGLLAPSCSSRKTDRPGTEVLGARPAGREGEERGTLATPAVYVAFADVACLTAEMQTTQDPGLSLLLDNK